VERSSRDSLARGELSPHRVDPRDDRTASRERERQTRAKANEAVRKLDRLAEEVTDDATKAQVRAVRADIADLGAEPEATGV
jgi:hypothetical protein